MKILIILNDPCYGTERSYNGLRLGLTYSKNESISLKVFLMGDAVLCAKSGQKVPPGYYNIETMFSSLKRKGAEVGVCGICTDTRGIMEKELIEGAHRSSIDELSSWSLEADKIFTF